MHARGESDFLKKKKLETPHHQPGESPQAPSGSKTPINHHHHQPPKTTKTPTATHQNTNQKRPNPPKKHPKGEPPQGQGLHRAAQVRHRRAALAPRLLRLRLLLHHLPRGARWVVRRRFFSTPFCLLENKHCRTASFHKLTTTHKPTHHSL